jgi:hypothetical protein
MKTDSKYNDVESEGLESSSFKMELSAHAVEILTKKVYTDIPRAIVRELIFNGVDACVKKGTKDPVEVYLPTSDNPNLVVEDFGCGMSPREIDEVYKVFFKSSKQNNNREVGMLGLGAKTPFAYVDQYTVTTSKSGKKTTYLVFLNEKGIPDITKAAEELCSQSGTKVEFPVKADDFSDFYRATIKTILFMKNVPSIKRGMEELMKEYRSAHSLYTEHSDTLDAFFRENAMWKKDLVSCGGNKDPLKVSATLEMFGDSSYGVIMGDIYYQVDSSVVNDDAKPKQEYMYPADADSWRPRKIVRINIGDVDIQTSREALNYTDKTKRFLKERFAQAFIDDSKRFLTLTPGNFVEKMSAMSNPSVFLKMVDVKGDGPLGARVNNIVADIGKNFKDAKLYVVGRGEKSQTVDNLEYHVKEIVEAAGKGKYHSITNLFNRALFNTGMKLDNVVMMDEKVEEKMKGRQNRIPQFIQNRLMTLKTGDFILANADGYRLLERYSSPKTPYDFSDLKLEKTAKGPKMMTARVGGTTHTGEPEFVDVNTMLKIEYDDLIEALKRKTYKKVVYEVYTGSCSNDSKNCWNEVVDIEKVKAGTVKKADCDKIVYVGKGWTSQIGNVTHPLSNRLQQFGGSMIVPDVKYVGVRFSSLVKLRLWEDPRFVQYTEFISTAVEEATKVIVGKDWGGMVKDETYFAKSTAEQILNFDFVKESVKFKGTKLYAELLHSVNASGDKSVNDLERMKQSLNYVVGDCRDISKVETKTFELVKERIKVEVERIEEAIANHRSVKMGVDDFSKELPLVNFIGLQSTNLVLWAALVQYAEAL